ncbi:hypothetical protein BU17DRAFT_79750 [Hysterangium stoloniferum]|nr:hypothetical protein BU17DRAFT_79750 [Hysterangium stoloniferum]
MDVSYLFWALLTLSRIPQILILHFFLDLRERNIHPHGMSATTQPEPLNTFRAVVRNAGNSILEDFQDLEYEEFLAARSTSEQCGEHQRSGQQEGVSHSRESQ